MPSHRSRRIWIALVGVTILVLAFFAATTAERQALPVSNDVHELATTSSRTEITTQNPKVLQTPAIEPISNKAVPLPALDAPFADVVDSLHERATNGDANAACRLAAEYAHCASLPRQLSEFERWLAQRQLAIKLNTDPILRQEAEGNIRRELGIRERKLSIVRMHCEDVDQASPVEIARKWLTAAKAGNLAAMKNFASGNAFRWDSILDVLPELSEFKSSAETMAIEVAKSGDQEMLLALAAAYSPMRIGSRNLLAQTVKPDRAKSIALYRFILATSTTEKVKKPGEIKGDVSDLIAELEALPGEDDQGRVEEFLTHFQKDWQPFGPGYVGNNVYLREGSVRSIDRADCAQ